MPAETDHSLDKWREWADRFNTAGAAARRAGIWLAFHNEPDHMKPIDGTVPYDVFVERTDPSVVRLQLDVGNMVMGGGDPMRYLSQYRDGIGAFISRTSSPTVRTTPSSVRAPSTSAHSLRRFPTFARKPVYVEQEGSTDSLASAARNFTFLSSLDF